MKRRPDQLPLFSDVPRETLAKYVKYLRGPFSQRELAGILGIDPCTVDKWERGDTTPQPTQIRHLLTHYREWAMRDELAKAAIHAAEALGLKKDLTSPDSRDKPPVSYATTET